MIKQITTLEAVKMYETLLPLTQNNARKFPGEVTWAIYRSFVKLEEIYKQYKDIQKQKVQEMNAEGKITVFENGGFSIPQEFTSEYFEFITPIEQSVVDVEIHGIAQESFDKLMNYELSFPEIAAFEKLLIGE